MIQTYPNKPNVDCVIFVKACVFAEINSIQKSTFHCYSNKVFEEAKSVSGQEGRTRGSIQRPDYLGDFSFLAKICDC